VPLDFIISVGDNFYDDGVNGTEDPQWDNTWNNVYNSLDHLKPLSWFSVLGNHDYHQNVKPQFEYSKLSAGKWNMDFHYFSREYRNTTSVKIIYTDSIWLGPDISAGTKIDNPTAKYHEQLVWLESELKGGVEFDWLIVIGHYPLYSAGANGDQKVMKTALKDLFEKHQVDAYISGHDHNLQHLTKNGIEYIITGSGALRGKIKRVTSADTVAFAQEEPGFTVHKITGKTMQVQFISGLTGDVRHEYTQHAKIRASPIQ
jgi:hypothetical protein